MWHCDLDLWRCRWWSITAIRVFVLHLYGVGNLSTNFGVSRTFLSGHIGQHLSDALRDLATLTFDCKGHGDYSWCGSSCSVCVSSLNFVGLPVRKIRRTSGLSISRPAELNLDFWPSNWCALLPVGRTNFLPILVFLERFVLDLSANTCQTRHVTLRPWLWSGRVACRWYRCLCSICVPSLKFLGFPFGRYCTFTV